MKTIKTEYGDLHYLSRSEFQVIIMTSTLSSNTKNYSWAYKFKEGDIIHISEPDGSTKIKTVRKKLILEDV